MTHRTVTENRSRWTWYRPTLLLLAVACIAWPLFAAGQILPDPSEATPSGGVDATPTHLLDDSVPRGAVQAYLVACRAGEFERAAGYLRVPTSGAAPASGADLARHLKVVLDQRLWVDLGSLSDQPLGDPDDGLSPGLDLVGVIETARGTVDILVERVHEGSRPVWRFAGSTVAAIPVLYSEYGYGPLGEFLPREFFVISFLELQLWQWLGLVLLVGLAALGGWLVGRLVFAVLSRVSASTATEVDDQLVKAGRRPGYLILAVVVFHLGLVPLRLAVPVREGLASFERALVIVASVWAVLRLIDVFANRTRMRLEREGQEAAVAVIPMGRKIVKAALLVLGFVALLQNTGINVTGLLAGLGVGGIALALAAQKSIENLFGGLMLSMDQPVRVGDFCRWTDKVGVVEEIGLRSTRIRTPDRTLVSIPNAQFADVQIENFAPRDRIRLHLVLQLRYETTPDQLRHVLVGLRKLLLGHPRVSVDPARVKFVNFGSSSLDVEVLAFVETTNFAEFLDVREDLYLRMMETVAASGTGFAFPSQTTYLARDSGLDKEATRSAEEQVKAWRESGSLPFPAFSPESRDTALNTLDYPPAGSESP